MPSAYFDLNFNPRSRVGNDCFRDLIHNDICISIHVPAWGTTVPPVGIAILPEFQSTFPRGERPCVLDYHSILCKFQSTFPRGERHSNRIKVELPESFQSTFPRGERRRAATIAFVAPEFQSTFPRGERRSATSLPDVTFYFNPRSRVGNDSKF